MMRLCCLRFASTQNVLLIIWNKLMFTKDRPGPV